MTLQFALIQSRGLCTTCAWHVWQWDCVTSYRHLGRPYGHGYDWFICATWYIILLSGWLFIIVPPNTITYPDRLCSSNKCPTCDFPYSATFFHYNRSQTVDWETLYTYFTLPVWMITPTRQKQTLIIHFNHLTPKISLVILLTVCSIVLVMLVWRIWYWIN